MPETSTDVHSCEQRALMSKYMTLFMLLKLVCLQGRVNEIKIKSKSVIRICLRFLTVVTP